MSYSVRHQIFVSSTFTDLIAERAEVIQAIWELDCIPTGMEAFVASNEDQWQVIKRVIDECDYYVLIIGARYGSLTDDGISYTEKEYRYAKKIGLPVLAFVHGEPDNIPVGKVDRDQTLAQKLDEFRTEVMADHPIRKWASATELGGLVSRSLVREIKVNPRPGWIRNDGSSPIALLERINKLTEENTALGEQLASHSSAFADETLESGDDKIVIKGTRTQRNNDTYNIKRTGWQASTSWNAIFRHIGPSLINETTEDELRAMISGFNVFQKTDERVQHAEVNQASWSEILIQLRALGLITQGRKKRGVNDKGSYWSITPKGDSLLVSLLARRKTTDDDLL